MSCSWNACSPEIRCAPVFFVVWTATSRIVVPAVRVRRKASSSAYATWLIREKSLASSGYDADIRSRLMGSSSRQHRLVDAEQPHRADRPAQQPPHDVAAALVAGCDAVADQHQGAAHVVGDHPQQHVVALVGPLVGPVTGLRAVALAGHLGRALEDRVDLVDLVEVVDALQQVGDALQAHAGVDVRLRQRAEDREVVLALARAALVLHEDEVPDLQVAVLVGDRAALATVLRAAVEVDLRARTRRPGHARSTSSCRPCRGAGSAPAGRPATRRQIS